jgi:hypothetical protein
LPPLAGAPLRIELRPGLSDRHGPAHAGAFLRERRIAFNCTRTDFPRIFVHELFHFVWLRLGNSRRRDFERLLAAEIECRVRGELGWAAEFRKRALSASDRVTRSRRWRDYACESFCDTAACLYSGVRRHAEFTLSGSRRGARQRWFVQSLPSPRVPI